MIFWDKVLIKYPTKLQPTKQETKSIPIVLTKWFIANNQGEQVHFARFHDNCMWNVNPETPWIDYKSNNTVEQEKLLELVPYFDQVTNFDLYTGTAEYQNKKVTWDPAYQWRYRNNRTVHFNKTPTEGTNSELSSNKGSSELDPDEDTAQVKELLKQAKTTITLAIQALSSRPGIPSPSKSPSVKTSLLLGKSKLSTTEISQIATPPMSKGKAPALKPPARTRASSSSPQPTQTTLLSSTAKPPVPLTLSRNSKGTTLSIDTNPSASSLKLPPQPTGGNPPVQPPAAPMAQPNPPPHILGTALESYNRKGDTVIAFWNSLENYFTVNAATFDTDKKKVSSALTYFKQGTQAGDWASDCISTIHVANPVNYGT